MTQDSSGAIDEQVDRAVRAGWLALGLSQLDVAEVFDAAFHQKDDRGPTGTSASRLSKIARVLDVSAHSDGRSLGDAKLQGRHLSSVESLHLLLALGLLQAFNELTDHRAKVVLIQLAQRMAERQATGCGDIA